ncbi:MAG: outer membrane lipoprotein carrier protein LolA [Flavobacteriales bacterium]|nr:outer membrane lipoprotein carrier protein LolA [Flavobacteriales bacterium]MCX7767519.1 outer membrane lipoprotein carrier protein LolA [Flavobacteriales bacterium]MDW8409654.1 outer membrane lipoprotein carrier protein LolA [Flavobacteriales bacterium]
MTKVFKVLLLPAIVFSMATNAMLELKAQSDKRAKDLLDKLSNKTKSLKSYKLNFTFVLNNREQNITQTKEGVLTVKGNKYHLKFDGQEIFCDGKNIYTYQKASNEAQVQAVDELDEESITPEKILTIYEKGFKFRLNEEDKSMPNLKVVDLYPLEPKKKDYSIIRLYIDEGKLFVQRALIRGKNGSDYTYNIKNMESNPDISDSYFVFDKNKFPGVKIIK